MSDKRLRVYIETSVLGGYGRKRFHDDFIKFFELVREGVFIPIISEHTLVEISDSKTPKEVIENIETLKYDEYKTTDEMRNLARKYLDKKIIVEEFYADALHIAIATVLNVDVLVSWNMKHIVNKLTIPLINNVNVKEEYNFLSIKKPEEII